MWKSRQIAKEILDEVENGAFSDETINRFFGQNKQLIPQDKSLITEIVYGVLRQKGKIDYFISKFAPLNNIKDHLINVLRVGVYQLVFLSKIPAYAAISECVDLVVEQKERGFVNAVLRRLSENKDNIKYPAGLSEKISIEYSHPLWLVEKWMREFGKENAIKLCEFNNQTPKDFCLRANSMKISREDLIKKLSELKIEPKKANFSPAGIYVDSLSEILSSDLRKERLFSIQGEISQLVSLFLNPLAGEAIGDFCCGVGGKTLHIVELMKDSGKIIAVDNYGTRLDILKNEVERRKIKSVETIFADVAKFVSKFKFDKILIDVPCSNLGVLRANPEIKWKLTAGDIGELAIRQLGLLNNAAKNLKSGGVILYSVCSFDREETLGVVNEFLQDNHEFKIENIKNFAPKTLSEDFFDKEFFKSLPFKSGLDGFFIARLKKD